MLIFRLQKVNPSFTFIEKYILMNFFGLIRERKMFLLQKFFLLEKIIQNFQVM